MSSTAFSAKLSLKMLALRKSRIIKQDIPVSFSSHFECNLCLTNVGLVR